MERGHSHGQLCVFTNFLPGQQQEQPAENGANIVTSLSPRISKRPDYLIFLFLLVGETAILCFAQHQHILIMILSFLTVLGGSVCDCVSLVAVIVSIVNVADGRRFS